MSKEFITVGNDTFEVVESVPLGYEIWNIGRNMVDGYLPLCRLSQHQPFSGARNIETDTLKAIKNEGAQLILDACSCQDTVEKMEVYVKRYCNAKPGTYAHARVQRIKKALPYMRQIKWS